MGFGRPHRHFRVTDSTNLRARALAEAGAPSGTVVTADEQTAGRGRRGRVWTAPEGKALLYSAILRPLEQRHLLLPLAVPVAVCETAERLRKETWCTVKWPNDVWLEERKLAGVLIESRPQDGWAVIGVGINLSIEPDEFPDDLRQPAISLGGGVSAAAARAELDAALERWVRADAPEVLSAWRSRDALLGRRVSWKGGSGVADGIEDSGDLVVVGAGGERFVLGAGEVSLSV